MQLKLANPGLDLVTNRYAHVDVSLRLGFLVFNNSNNLINIENTPIIHMHIRHTHTEKQYNVSI